MNQINCFLPQPKKMEENKHLPCSVIRRVENIEKAEKECLWHERNLVGKDKCMLKNKIQLSFKDIISFFHQFMNWTASHLANRTEIWRAIHGGRFLQNKVSRNKEVNWTFADWLKQGYFSHLKQRVVLETSYISRQMLIGWLRDSFSGIAQFRNLNFFLLMETVVGFSRSNSILVLIWLF